MPDINRAYQWAIDTCNAPNVGYSNDYRNQRTVNGITYYDCSSFIWYALKDGGFDVEGAYLTATGRSYSGNAIVTANERPWLAALGFVEVPLSGEWLPGDILWRSSPHGHTEMVYSGGTGQGISMGAHQASVPLARQVSINTYTGYASNWAHMYRYGGGAVPGISLFVVAAICGNFYAESDINPGVWEDFQTHAYTDLNVGFGLGQWTNTGGDHYGRLYQMADWMVSMGYSPDDGNGQLQYILYEDDWAPVVTLGGVTYTSAYNTLTDFLHSTDTNLDNLVEEWCHHWERIPGNLPARRQYAQDCYNYLLTHANDTSITSWIVGNRYLTVSEVMNNAVMLYRFLGSGGGGGGTGVSRKMPIWMYRPWWLI